MRTIKQLLWLGLLPWLLAGCSTTITNLTPGQMPRNSTGLYPFQVAWASNQRSLQNETLRAWVLIGLNAYPMQQTPLVKDRWETLVPVPPNESLVHYHYKFEYEYLGIPHRKLNSTSSPTFTLKLNEP